MVSRGAIIAALVVVELAILGEMGASMHAGQRSARLAPLAPLAPLAGQPVSGVDLVEDGPHEVFQAGARPNLIVDIGYADLTIVARSAPQVDVAVSKSDDFGFMRARSPIRVLADGDTVHIATTTSSGWSAGDDRMVTVVVPPQTRVTVFRAGDIRANGLRGEASFASAGNGSVTVEDYNAPLLQIASSTEIRMDRIVADRLEATSSDGGIDASDVRLRNGNVESDGRVTIGVAAGSDSLIFADTDDGTVQVSGFATVPEPGTERASRQTVRVGAGTGRLHVHANDGDIRLTQD